MKRSEEERVDKQGDFPLYGWDDGKVYYWDEDRKHEWCVSDDEALYRRLVEICRRHILEKGGKEK